MQANLFGPNDEPGPRAELVTMITTPVVKHGRQTVPRLLVEDAVKAQAYFNAQTGRACRPYTGRGKPSESLSRIIGAMLDYPEVRTEWRRMIDRCLADPWWDGPASTGVIFGPRVVEASIARAQSNSPNVARMKLTASGQALRALRLARDESIG